ncbi:MAG: type II toxin-antitoxin system RelE/ParE family toxin [Desulfuromonadaceae bacterium]|nr:type II toxin-antitoxin system RelE/ParE family toxin [Desulfuromonadaceae bacterium]MDD2855882.1 type II toxin-antitoxin system RelE/ParE family toxin [Desulfuromonadaceae bacterium]
MPALFKVEITPTAEADVTEIWDYIAQDNPGNAEAFISRLSEQIDTLENFPERCPLIAENRIMGTSYRHLIYGHYRTIFRIVGDCVIILRIIHGARLLDSGLFESD